jgi:hypothetical protein
MKPRSKSLLPLFISVLAAAATLLSGCGAPTSRGLIGSTPKQLDPAEWNGHWRSEDSSFVIRVADAEGGLLELAEFDEKDNALHVSVNHLYVREEGDATLFNLIDAEDPGQNYTFGRMVRKPNAAVFWPARTDSMEQLIARQLIAGQVKVQNNSKQVTVTGGYEMLARQLAAPEGWLLLQMDEPFTIMRDKQGL